MTRQLNLILDRLLGLNSEGYERLMAFSSLGWALTLAMFEVTFTWPNFRLHATIAPEWVWALTSGMIGGLHLIGLVTGHYQTRLLASWFSMPFWWLVFGLFASDFPKTTAPAIYFVHAFLASWTCILLTGESHGNRR